MINIFSRDFHSAKALAEKLRLRSPREFKYISDAVDIHQLPPGSTVLFWGDWQHHPNAQMAQSYLLAKNCFLLTVTDELMRNYHNGNNA